MAGGGTPVTFALAGLVALVTASSYARLSVRYAGAGVLEVTYRTLGTKGPRKRRREARVTRTL